MIKGMNPCFECGNPSQHRHHVVPRVMGGSKTVFLCTDCHGKIHGLEFLNHRELTKKGLAAAKARGVELGKAGRDRARENKANADKFAKELAPVIKEIQSAGVTTGRGIAAELNRREIPTARGGRWHLLTVQNLLGRIRTFGNYSVT